MKASTTTNRLPGLNCLHGPPGLKAALGALLLIAACAQATGEPAFRRSVFIGDRGISVPLPPPSLFEAPKQRVDIEVEVQGDGSLPAGTELRIVDNEGEAETALMLAGDETEALAVGIEIDLTMNCLEVWLVEGDREGEHALFTASIDTDGQTVLTTPGCE